MAVPSSTDPSDGSPASELPTRQGTRHINEKSPKAPERDVENLLLQLKLRSKAKTVGIIATICLIFTLVGLDSNIVATAVPAMTRDFGTIADIGWYAAVYFSLKPPDSGSFQVFFGKVYSMFPTKPVILADLAVFTVGSLLCALAPTSTAFIIGRAVVGLATAGAISGAFAIIVYGTPLQERPTVAGIGGATEAIASLAAPLAGGLLIDHLGWRWCYYIEVPLIALTFFIVLFIPSSHRQRQNTFRQLSLKIRRLDLLGAAAFIACITTLMLAFRWGGVNYPWGNWRVVLNLVFFALLLATFAWLQHHRQEKPMLPPRILAWRSVIAGLCFSFCNNAALSIVEYYMPIYFQVVRSLSVFMSGVMVLPTGVGLVLSVFLAGFLTSRFGYYNPFMIATGILTPVATGLMTTIKPETAVWMLVVYQGLLGFGAGIGFQGPQVAVQTLFADDDSQIGLAAVQFAQSVGPAVFVSVAQNIFANRLVATIRQDDPEIDATDLINQGLAMLNDKSQEMVALISSYTVALTQTFYLSVSLATLTLFSAAVMEWRSVKAKSSCQ